MNLEIARNPSASPQSLDELVSKYDSKNRDLGEALILNPNLNAQALARLLLKCPLDLQVLAIKHPNLSWADQLKIASAVDSDILRTKARLLLLERLDLDIGILTALCLDPHKEVRDKAHKKLKRDHDTDSSNS